MKKWLSEGHFQEGTMKPKIEAAIYFLEHHGEKVIITSIDNIEDETRKMISRGISVADPIFRLKDDDNFIVIVSLTFISILESISTPVSPISTFLLKTL